MNVSLPLQILLRFLLTILLVLAMQTFMDQYFFLSGGWTGIVVVSALLTLMNLIVRPILNAITLPLRFLATILAIILVNGVFLWLTYAITFRMDPDIVTLEILGGFGGWLVVALTLGIANWAMKMIVK